MPRPLKRPPTPRPRRRVLLAMYWWEDRVFEGVARFAAAHGWILDCRMRWTHTVPEFADWRGDGIIANPGVTHPLRPLVTLLERSGVPVVGLQKFGDYPAAARVVSDHAAIGRSGAEHLLALDLRHLGFVIFNENPIERGRCDAFAAAVRAAGREFIEIPWREFRERGRALPRPCGLMAANDLNAVAVATACLDAGLRLPQEVALVGVDDTRLLCDLLEVPLSSVNCNFEEQGYRAAEALQRLMDGETAPRAAVVIAPQGVTGRRSTDTFALPDPAAVEALRILRDRFRETLSIADIAAEVGAPLRKLQALFRRHLGHTMIHELTQARVTHACRLLADPRRKLDAVAVESGFANRFHFVRAFRRVTGRTPKAFRREWAERQAPV